MKHYLYFSIKFILVGIIQNQSIKGLVYSYIGVVVGFITTGYLMPRFLLPDEVGLLRVLVSYAVLLAQFSGLGFSIVAVKMFPYFRDQATRHHGFFGLFSLISLIGFLLVMTIFGIYSYFFMADDFSQSPLLKNYFYWIIPLTFFVLLYNIADAYYRALFDAIKGTILKDVVQRILILITLILFILQFYTLGNLILYYSLAFAIPPFIMFYHLVRDRQIGWIPDFKFLNKELRKNVWNVALFGLLSSFSGILVLNIDVLMVERFMGLTQAGLYTITFFFGTLIMIPARPLTRISSIVIAEAFMKDDISEVDTIYKKSSINLTSIAILVFLGLAINMENIMTMIGEDYRAGYAVIILIGLSNVIEMSTGVINQIIFNSKFYRYSSYFILFFAILIIISNIVFIPIYGIMGAALATLIAKSVYIFVKLGFVKLKLGLNPYSIKSILVLVIGLFTYYTQSFISPIDNYIVDIFIRSSFATIIFSILVFLFKISPDINKWLKTSINSLINSQK